MLTRENLQWLRIVLVSQCVLAALEVFHVLRCDAEAFDCDRWQWQFAYIANFPASYVLEMGLDSLPSSFAVDYVVLNQGVRFLTYVLGGTLWWVALGAISRTVRGSAKQSAGRPEQ
jgi:hypothetical protein